jgi:predicted GIY-YIG superfamily endonuclease
MAKRETHRYHLKRGHTIIRSGITNDLDRREKKHQQEYGPDVHITKVGRVTTRNAALAWEKEERKGTP